jgi:hypothetical protein
MTPLIQIIFLYHFQHLPKTSGGGLTLYFLTRLFTLGGRGGGLLLILTKLFDQGRCLPEALPHNTNKGHYLPCKIYCLVLACISYAVIHIRPLSLCMM